MMTEIGKSRLMGCSTQQCSVQGSTFPEELTSHVQWLDESSPGKGDSCFMLAFAPVPLWKNMKQRIRSDVAQSIAGPQCQAMWPPQMQDPKILPQHQYNPQLCTTQEVDLCVLS